MAGFIGLFQVQRVTAFYCSVLHTRALISTLTSLPLLGSGFQRRMFPPSGFPNYFRTQLPHFNSNSSPRLNPLTQLSNLLLRLGLRLNYGRRSVGQPVLVSSLPLVSMNRFFFSSPLSVASYDSQGCGGSIPSRIHTGERES
jgi:hypothetical protein